jgi:putative FmdB family regulatory protein
MPIYEYRCEKCQKRFEKIQKVSDKPCKKCPSCGGPLRKLMSSSSIQFKGNGFYITDYPKKSVPSEDGKTKAVTKPEKSGESKADGKAAETIPSDKPCSD